jgi:hypothetical protein
VTSASIFPMGEQREDQQRTPVHPGQRVLSNDYGAGTVEGVTSSWVFIQWDKPFIPGAERVVVHDVPFAERLEKLPPEEKT